MSVMRTDGHIGDMMMPVLTEEWTWVASAWKTSSLTCLTPHVGVEYPTKDLKMLESQVDIRKHPKTL